MEVATGALCSRDHLQRFEDFANRLGSLIQIEFVRHDGHLLQEQSVLVPSLETLSQRDALALLVQETTGLVLQVARLALSSHCLQVFRCHAAIRPKTDLFIEH